MVYWRVSSLCYGRFWPIGLENRVGFRVRFLLFGKYLYAVYLDEAFL